MEEFKNKNIDIINDEEKLFDEMAKEEIFEEFSLALKNRDVESIERIIKYVKSVYCKQQFLKEFEDYCDKIIEKQMLEHIISLFNNKDFSISISDETVDLRINIDKEETVEEIEESMEKIEQKVVNKYNNIEELKPYSVRERLYKILHNIIKNFYNSVSDFVPFIQRVMPVLHFDGGHTFYGYDLKDATEYNVAAMLLSNYKDCLMDWIKDFVVHLTDLSYLVTQNTQYVMALSMCYHRTKALCRKLYFAIDEVIYNIDTFADEVFAENENYKEIKSIINSVDYNSLSELRNVYQNMYEDICELGDLLFIYKNQYEGSVKIITPDDKQ